MTERIKKRPAQEKKIISAWNIYQIKKNPRIINKIIFLLFLFYCVPWQNRPFFDQKYIWKRKKTAMNAKRFYFRPFAFFPRSICVFCLFECIDDGWWTRLSSRRCIILGCLVNGFVDNANRWSGRFFLCFSNSRQFSVFVRKMLIFGNPKSCF